MRYYIYENELTKHLAPFSLNHASFEMRCGAFRNIDRVAMLIEDEAELCLLVREEIQDIVKERFPMYCVNPERLSNGFYLDGASIIHSKEDLEGSYIEKDLLTYNNGKFSESISPSSCALISYLWEIFDYQDLAIKVDIKAFGANIPKAIDSVIVINEELVHISPSAYISSGVIIDATDGPVIIDNHAKIEIGSLIKGPAYIGIDTIINPGTKIRGNVSFGPRCKVGGEVEDSVIHAYSNKQHEGYLGHSYIGEWVNIGAGTSTSDLKNNYSKIKYFFSDTLSKNSERIFLGSMIGDYSTIGILSMLNSGTNIGLCSNVFGGGFQKKYFKSFSWGESDRVDFDKLVKTIKVVKSRRDKVLSDTQIKFLFDLYDNN